ncbi:MAG: hypothetical protein IGS48_07265 [Oscillatoriales cyanobacterium C42_A2020_001]|nr:hypothetical protein [Leptolyngbyaceae cyanobacterium C42_A2020_001]
MKSSSKTAIAQSTQLNLQPRLHLQKTRHLAGFILLAGLTASCTQFQSTPVDLSLSIKPSGRPGVYVASGTSNLPDRSRIIISGVRYLQPSTDSTPLRPRDANYAILDREIVEVNQDRWETTLSLWQLTSNGNYQESWQQQQTNLGVPFKASGQVVFTATFEPENQSASVNQQVQNQNLQGSLLRFTEDGQPYLQASQTLPVGLPSGKTTSPTGIALDQESSWESRSTVRNLSTKVSVGAPPKEKQVDAPLSPESRFH